MSLIEECNFKHDAPKEILSSERINACSISLGRECCGEENCVLFQIYMNTPKMITKKDWNLSSIEKGEDGTRTCKKCGKKSNQHYSSGYCDSCYCEVCYK